MHLCIRHLQRIDDLEDYRKPEYKEGWKNNTNKLKYKENPYLCVESDNCGVDKMILNFNEIRDDYKDFFIISSPFLRCIQTSLLVADALEINKNNIKIDFSLGEINSEGLFCGGAYETEIIYKLSLEYLQFPDDKFEIINRNYKGGSYEDDWNMNNDPNFVNTDKDYYKRINAELKSLNESTEWKDKNIIICTHNDALRDITCTNPTTGKKIDTAKIGYNRVVNLNECNLSLQGGSNYKLKYLKYKKKYLELKNNL
jgi:broad specificity phosphatase PhoE